MTKITPQELAATLARHFQNVNNAIAYAENIASYSGPLSADYAQAADILKGIK